MTVLKIQNIAKTYGDVQALKGVDLEVREGHITALLGPNGSGKSTLIRSVVTLQPIESGTVTLNGVDVGKDPAEARTHLGYAGQDVAVDKTMTGREFLRFQAGLVHIPKRDAIPRIDSLLSMFDLSDVAGRLTETYSGGMKRRLDLAASLLHEPKLLVLDEPSSGIDFEGRRKFWEILLALRQQNKAMLIATHDFEEIDHLADEVIILKKGEKVAQGPPSQLRQELGHFMLSASLHEHVGEGDKKPLHDLFQEFQGVALPEDPASAEVTFAVTEDSDPRTLGDRLMDKASERGLTLFSSSVRQPTLVDVYRHALGEEADLGGEMS